MKQKYDVAAYIWPAYTGDEPRTRMFWQEGMGEWQSVKNAVPKFEGHDWPRKPLWGYVNEADPAVMEMEINEAVRHGVNVFIYDWYWYDSRPFLENCLNDGFLKAKNREQMQFYLMWANHDANNLWNIDLSDDYGDVVNWQGGVGWDNFRRVVDRVITRYFTQPNYYKIDGCPVFCLYDLFTFIEGLGGPEEAKKGIAYFREEVKKAGFPNVHLQLIAWGQHRLNYSGVDSSGSAVSVDFEELGFDSITHYQFCHYCNIDRPYREILPDVKAEWDRIDREISVPFFPHVSVGWDNNPRFKRFRPGIMKETTPDAIREGVAMAAAYIDAHPELPVPLITVNSWNEWTETSYLEPDDLNGYGYLEAIRSVVCEKE